MSRYMLGRGLSALVLAALSGCGLTDTERTAVQRFAATAEALGELALEELPRMRELQRELKVRAVDVATELEPSSPAGDRLILNTVLGSWPDLTDADQVAAESAFYGDFDADRLALRMNAARALRDYGQALRLLASHSEESELRAASDALTTSLRNIPGGSLSKGELGLIGSLVQNVGLFLVEQKRKDGIRQIVATSRADVRALILELQVDFDPDEPGVASLVFDATNQVDLVTPVALRNATSDAAKRRAAEDVLFGDASARYLATTATPAATEFGALAERLAELDDALASDTWYAGAFTDAQADAFAELVRGALAIRADAAPVRSNLDHARGGRRSREPVR